MTEVHHAGGSSRMGSHDTDILFSDSIPEFYEAYLVPLIFEPYAVDLARRLASRPLTRVLEIAAGTGIVTRALASTLPDSVSIVATYLNHPRLHPASARGAKRTAGGRRT